MESPLQCPPSWKLQSFPHVLYTYKCAHSNTLLYVCIRKHTHAWGLCFQESGKCKRIFVYLCTRLLCQGSWIDGEVPVYSDTHSVTQSVCRTGTGGPNGLHVPHWATGQPERVHPGVTGQTNKTLQVRVSACKQDKGNLKRHFLCRELAAHM